MEIGAKIYFDKATGNVLVNTGQRSGMVVETTPEQDFAVYTALVDRVPESVGVIQLDYGQHAEDFGRASGYRINLETGELEFSFPDQDADPEAPQEPTYQAPLSTQVEQLQLALTDNYEQMLTAQQEATNAQVALADLYELTLSLQAEVTALKGGAS